MTNFQASAGVQGRQFADQCDQLLRHTGFRLAGPMKIPAIGVEIDQVAVGPSGATIWFEYKGSIQGVRPGLRRTDTLKKAIANGALLAADQRDTPYIILTSHLPTEGAGLAMLNTALKAGYIADVICIYDPSSNSRLKQL